MAFCFFFFVFFLFLYKHVLYINKCLTIECLLGKCITYYRRSPLWLFPSNGDRKERKIMQIEAEKNYCLASMSRFIWVSEFFKFFLLQANVGGVNSLSFLSYGEHNLLFISAICLLKTPHLSAFINFFFLMSNKVHPHNFSPVQKYWSQQQFLNTLNNIYLNKFQSRVFLQWDYFGSKQNLKIARSLCTKVLSRIVSIKLFVLWQFLKPPIKKVKRDLIATLAESGPLDFPSEKRFSFIVCPWKGFRTHVSKIV